MQLNLSAIQRSRLTIFEQALYLQRLVSQDINGDPTGELKLFYRILYGRFVLFGAWRSVNAMRKDCKSMQALEDMNREAVAMVNQAIMERDKYKISNYLHYQYQFIKSGVDDPLSNDERFFLDILKEEIGERNDFNYALAKLIILGTLMHIVYAKHDFRYNQRNRNVLEKEIERACKYANQYIVELLECRSDFEVFSKYTLRRENVIKENKKPRETKTSVKQS